MTHLQLENLASEYLEGRLDPARHAEVEKHLAICNPCEETLSDLKLAIQACRSAGKVTPPPWLITRIRQATTGKVHADFTEQIGALLHNIRQPRLAYALAMAVFSISLLANIAGLNFRHLNMQDLNPATWVYRADRAGHLLYARAEKFYADLRIVYEIESRFRNAEPQASEQEKEPSKSKPSQGRPASTAGPESEQMAYTTVDAARRITQMESGVQAYEMR